MGMKLQRNGLTLVVCLLVCSGCGLSGLIGKKGVTNEQINVDISNKKVKITEGAYASDHTWYFSPKDERCFVVNENESKIADSSADLSITISSWRFIPLRDVGPDDKYGTVLGKMLLHYKKDGEKWVLENLEPKELIYKDLDMDQWKKFLEITAPNCAKRFRHTDY